MAIPSLAVLLALVAGQPVPPATPAPSPEVMEGVWEGTMANTQFGKCGWAAPPERVRIVVRLGDDGEPTGWLAPLDAVPPSATPKDNLKIKIVGDKVRIEHERIAQCGETFKRKYAAKLEGRLPSMVDGKRMLVLDGLDVPCIQSGCSFGVAVSAEWKGPRP
jgi:hypothetical protein